MRKKERGELHTQKNAGYRLALGALSALLVCFAVLFLCAAGVSAGLIGEAQIARLAALGSLLGCFAGARSASGGERQTLCMAGAAALFCILLLMIGRIAYHQTLFQRDNLMVLLGAALGLLLALAARRRPKRTAKRKR